MEQTILSVLGKLFTRIMNNRLVTWAEEYRIYVEAQGGFRPGRGTVDNIFVLDGIVNSYLSSGKALYSAFIDFSKAFDYVVRDNLWYKLIKAGVSGKMLTMIRSIYEHVKTKVFFQENKSDEFECSLGVRQGDCLSPFLFAMYINDLEHVLIITNVVLNLVSTKCLLCYMQTMLSCYRIRVPGYRKRWMLCKIIQIDGS